MDLCLASILRVLHPTHLLGFAGTLSLKHAGVGICLGVCFLDTQTKTSGEVLKVTGLQVAETSITEPQTYSESTPRGPLAENQGGDEPRPRPHSYLCCC